MEKLQQNKIMHDEFGNVIEFIGDIAAFKLDKNNVLTENFHIEKTEGLATATRSEKYRYYREKANYLALHIVNLNIKEEWYEDRLREGKRALEAFVKTWPHELFTIFGHTFYHRKR